MTWITFTPMATYDPDTRQAITKTSGQVFAMGDTSFSTPLPMRDEIGITITEVRIDDVPLTPTFQADVPLDDDFGFVQWRSGVTGIVMQIVSSQGLANDAKAAAVAAQASQVAAAGSAQQVADFIAGGGGGGGGGGVTVHGLLSGLTADDHKQYLTETRGDARYYPQTTADTNLANAVVNRLRFDASQGLTNPQKAQGKANLGLAGFTIAAARSATDPVLTDAQALALYGEGAFFTVDPA